jgi:hypothetical protein
MGALTVERVGMRAKGINQMSTRRAVRPDAMVYRQTRRLARRKRTLLWPAVAVGIIVLAIIVLFIWIRHRH